jgi:hypothetical protein
MDWAQWVGGAVSVLGIIGMMAKLGRDLGRSEAKLEAAIATLTTTVNQLTGMAPQRDVDDLRKRVDRTSEATAELKERLSRQEERVLGLGEQLAHARNNANAGA